MTQTVTRMWNRVKAFLLNENQRERHRLINVSHDPDIFTGDGDGVEENGESYLSYLKTNSQSSLFSNTSVQPFLQVGPFRNQGNWSLHNGNGTNDSNNDLESSKQTYSLAKFKTTPKIASYLITLCMLLSHGLFWYGQTYPMWKLHYSLNADLNLTPTNAESKLLFSRLKWSSTGYNWYKNETKIIETFTYMSAIEKLWEAKNLPSVWLSKFSAVLLVVFSGIWPHVKLILLHFNWYNPYFQQNTRATQLHYLAAFGKFSLADIFVVCLLIGVLNLDLTIEPNTIIHGLKKQMPIYVDIVQKNFNLTQAQQNVCATYFHLIGFVLFTISIF